jgi:alanine racemase
MDMCRVGIGLYGLYSSPAVKAWRVLDLEPALSWKSLLSHVKWLPEGSGVSYGHHWRAEKDTLVGTVPLGYADGYSRTMGNKGRVLVGGRSAPVIGRICMDQFMVDLTAVPEARPGDEVVLIGKQGDEEISADEVAGLMDTINYEVVCMIGARVPRRYRP